MTQTTTAHAPDIRPLPALEADPGPDSRPRAKLLDLSLTQLLGGSMAAATAAALGSRLGVVGTIAGAAVLSVVSAIAANLYTTSMARAKDAVVLVRSRRDGVALEAPDRWRRPDRATTRRALATTGAVFVVAAAFLAGLQLATGAQVTGTNLGGRPAAGVVDSPKGSADSGGTTGGATAEQDDRGTSTSAPTSGIPTTTSTTGTPEPAAPSTVTPGQTPGPGGQVTTPLDGATTGAGTLAPSDGSGPTTAPPGATGSPGSTGSIAPRASGG